jgi:hypothetical protein
MGRENFVPERASQIGSTFSSLKWDVQTQNVQRFFFNIVQIVFYFLLAMKINIV